MLTTWLLVFLNIDLIMNLFIGFMSWATILESGNRGTLELSIFVLFQVHALSVFLWFIYFMVTFEPLWRTEFPERNNFILKQMEWTNYKLIFNIEVSKVGILFVWYYVHKIFLESSIIVSPITAVIITYSILLIPLGVVWTFVWVHLLRGERLRLMESGRGMRVDFVRYVSSNEGDKNNSSHNKKK